MQIVITSLLVVLTTLWGFRFIERILFHVALWQRKEYRWDRFRAHLMTTEGCGLVFRLYTPAAIAAIALLFFFDGVDLVVALAGLGAILTLVSGIGSIRAVARVGMMRPKWTTKALLLCALTVPIVGIIPFIYFLRLAPLDEIFIGVPALFLCTLLALPLITALLVLALHLPSETMKRRTILKATKKMETRHDLLVIGITGSYGKSSVKEYVSVMLERKYRVCKTPKNVNSAIGVAQTILRDLQPEHTAFVVEMGAYRSGEIAEICAMVRPTMGVVTAVGEQHLSLFGKTINAVADAKFELIAALPENGVAVLNADNSHVRSMAERTSCRVITYALERPADVRAESITIQPEKLSFSVQINGDKQHVVASLVGAQHVSNLLGAIAIAEHAGIPLADIASTIATITPIAHTMQVMHHTSGAIIIDDAYSANPDGVIAALNHLKIIPRKNKVLVMMPMIELGAAAKDAHRRVGTVLGETCDVVIWTKRDFAKILLKSASENGLPPHQFHTITRPRDILDTLAPHLNENTVILLENRIPALVITNLLQ